MSAVLAIACWTVITVFAVLGTAMVWADDRDRRRRHRGTDEEVTALILYPTTKAARDATTSGRLTEKESLDGYTD